MKKIIKCVLTCAALNSALVFAADLPKNTSPPPNGVMFTDIGIAKASTTGDIVTCTNSNGVKMQSTPWSYKQLKNKVIDTIVLNGMTFGGTAFYCKAATGNLQILMVADQSTQTSEIRIYINKGAIVDQKIGPMDPTQWVTVEQDFLNASGTDFMPREVKSGESLDLFYANTIPTGSYMDDFTLSYSNSN